MPFLHLDPSLERKSKRNVLTSGAASTYMFTSFELSDDNGILLGLNRHNNSLCIVDPFNTKVNKNATVSMVDLNGVFVSLDGGIDCLCTYPKRGRPPRGARATVRILGINHENNRIWGVITHMSTTR